MTLKPPWVLTLTSLAALASASISLPARAAEPPVIAPSNPDAFRSLLPEQPHEPALKAALKSQQFVGLPEKRPAPSNAKRKQSKKQTLDIGCITTE